ncbi:DUF4440 domain-containing protein [Nisaea acidiphila]|uniref:DUF4440 domain-containing protein n=1 Tax=Nisaea acidiphila TaxID=1862145 RepID=A0A9J7AWC7_9PROT|nr:nuclear transport factor 2 family protein [Nisaea acidiphila]UUX51106.1 DUF4440 domain-containing protein [Nisaea acidiphila]
MENQNAVLNTILTMTANLEKGDLDGVMAAYEPDAAILFEPNTPVADAALSRQIFSELAAANPSVSYGEHEVYVAGDIAIHLAPWSMKGESPAGDPVAMGGLTVAVLRRQPDGKWLMVLDNPHGAHALSAANAH